MNIKNTRDITKLSNSVDNIDNKTVQQRKHASSLAAVKEHMHICINTMEQCLQILNSLLLMKDVLTNNDIMKRIAALLDNVKHNVDNYYRIVDIIDPDTEKRRL